MDVIAFVREVVERFPDMRDDILGKLIQSFPEFRNGKVYRGAMWIVGDYATSISNVNDAMQQIRKVLGEIPILASEKQQMDQSETAGAMTDDNVASAPKPVSMTRVRADGTYATESAFTTDTTTDKSSLSRSKPPPVSYTHLTLPTNREV